MVVSAAKSDSSLAAVVEAVLGQLVGHGHVGDELVVRRSLERALRHDGPQPLERLEHLRLAAHLRGRRPGSPARRWPPARAAA